MGSICYCPGIDFSGSETFGCCECRLARGRFANDKKPLSQNEKCSHMGSTVLQGDRLADALETLFQAAKCWKRGSPVLQGCRIFDVQELRKQCVASFVPPCLFNDYLSTGEATCYFPDEGSKKSSRKPVYEMWYFWNRGVVEPGMQVVRMSFRLDYLLPSSGK